MTDTRLDMVWVDIIQILEPDTQVQRVCVEIDGEPLRESDIGKRIHVVYEDNDTVGIHSIELLPNGVEPPRRQKHPIIDVLFDITGIGRIYHSSGAHSQIIVLYSHGRSIAPSLVNATIKIQYTGDIHTGNFRVHWSDITRWDP